MKQRRGNLLPFHLGEGRGERAEGTATRKLCVLLGKYSLHKLCTGLCSSDNIAETNHVIFTHNNNNNNNNNNKTFITR